MNDANDVSRRMSVIMQSFLRGQSITETETDPGLIIQQLNETENEFRSVAFEAAAMVAAISDFDTGNGLIRWNDFLERTGSRFASQLHVGLGWAMAQKNIPLSEIPENTTPIMYFRVLDGYGYYDGIFRHKSAVDYKIIPPEFSKLLSGYDQGLGRSLYYYCKGSIDKLPAIISSFPESRHSDLWRGIGIATVFVGGGDDKMLNDIFTLAGKFKTQLSAGAALVARTRYDSGSVTPFAQLACNIWCNKLFEDVVDITFKTESSVVNTKGDYLQWIAFMLREFTPANAERK